MGSPRRLPGAGPTIKKKSSLSIGVEPLFTSALGLQLPWQVSDVKLDTGRRRIDFEVTCAAKNRPCPACGATAQDFHDRVRRTCRHLDFFQHEAWPHADVPRIGCQSRGKTSQCEVSWSRPGCGFSLLFEALALSRCQSMPGGRSRATVARARQAFVGAHRTLRGAVTGTSRWCTICGQNACCLPSRGKIMGP
jgi:hypothetical protein